MGDAALAGDTSLAAAAAALPPRPLFTGGLAGFAGEADLAGDTVSSSEDLAPRLLTFLAGVGDGALGFAAALRPPRLTGLGDLVGDSALGGDDATASLVALPLLPPRLTGLGDLAAGVAAATSFVLAALPRPFFTGLGDLTGDALLAGETAAAS